MSTTSSVTHSTPDRINRFSQERDETSPKSTRPSSETEITEIIECMQFATLIIFSISYQVGVPSLLQSRPRPKPGHPPLRDLQRPPEPGDQDACHPIAVLNLNFGTGVPLRQPGHKLFFVCVRWRNILPHMRKLGFPWSSSSLRFLNCLVGQSIPALLARMLNFCETWRQLQRSSHVHLSAFYTAD